MEQELRYFILAPNEKNEFGVVGKKGYVTEGEAVAHAEVILKSNGHPSTMQFTICHAFATVRRVVPPVEVVFHALSLKKVA